MGQNIMWIPWYSDELVELSTDRDDLFREAKIHKDYGKLILARELRNQVKTGVINSRGNYYTKLIEDNREDPSRFWKSINQLLPNTKENNIDVLYYPKPNPCVSKVKLLTLLIVTLILWGSSLMQVSGILMTLGQEGPLLGNSPLGVISQ